MNKKKNNKRGYLKYMIAIFFVGILVLMNSCMTMRTSTKAIVSKFNKKGITPIIKTVSFEGKTLRYMMSDTFDVQKPTILFVHGAPGSLSNFDTYMQDSILREKVNLITIDRLGYGFSDFGKAEVLISKQAKSIEKLTSLFDKNKTILVGWSNH